MSAKKQSRCFRQELYELRSQEIQPESYHRRVFAPESEMNSQPKASCSGNFSSSDRSVEEEPRSIQPFGGGSYGSSIIIIIIIRDAIFPPLTNDRQGRAVARYLAGPDAHDNDDDD